MKLFCEKRVKFFICDYKVMYYVVCFLKCYKIYGFIFKLFNILLFNFVVFVLFCFFLLNCFFFMVIVYC